MTLQEEGTYQRAILVCLGEVLEYRAVNAEVKTMARVSDMNETQS